MAIPVPRLIRDNYVQQAATLRSASSEQAGFEVSAKMGDQARGRRWRSQLGWTFTPAFNDEFPFWTTTDGFRLAHIAPGSYATGALTATALQTAMGVAGASPLGIGASLWLRADSVTVVNGLVTQLTDLSGNNRHATQASSGLQGTWVANAVDGRAGVYFPGDVARGYSTSALMSSMLAATTGRSTIFWVFRLDSDAVANDTFWWAGASSHFMSAVWSGGLNFGAQVYTTADVTATKAGTNGVGVWQIGCFEYDGANVMSFVGNANSAAAQNAAQTGNVHSDVLNSVLNVGLSQILKGYFNELIVYPGTLSQAQRQQNAQYLKGRYPSLVDATSAPAWTDTNTVSYSNTSKKFSFTTSAAQLKILGATAVPALDLAAAAFKDLGLTLADKTGAATYTADNAAYQSRHWLKADLGAAAAITAAFALDHNAGASGGTFTLHGNAIDQWLSPAPTQSQALTGDVYQRSAYFNSSSLRWLRLVIEDVQNTAGYAELGVWLAGPYLQPRAYANIFTPGYKDLSQVAEATFGADHLDERPQRDRWVVLWRNLDTSERDAFVTLRRTTPVGRCFFFAFDASGAPTDVEYVKFEAELEIEMDAPYWTVRARIAKSLP